MNNTENIRYDYNKYETRWFTISSSYFDKHKYVTIKINIEEEKRKKHCYEFNRRYNN